MKKVPAIIMVLTLIASGAYIAIYLDRWEWTRALFITMIFVIAEIALVGWLVIQRLQRIEARFEVRDQRDEVFDEGVLLRIRQTRPEYDRFAWLRESMHRTNVFITMVVGGGVVLSGLAWVVDKVAGGTVTANREQQLARQLHRIAFPTGHFVADEASLIAQEFPACDDTDLRLLVGDTRGFH